MILKTLVSLVRGSDTRDRTYLVSVPHFASFLGFPYFLATLPPFPHTHKLTATYIHIHIHSMPSTNTSRQSSVSTRDCTVCPTNKSKRFATRTIADTNQTNDNTNTSTPHDLNDEDDKTMRKKRCITSLTARNEDELWVDISNKRLPNSRLGALYAGSRFVGIQECGSTSYEVVVDIQVCPGSRAKGRKGGRSGCVGMVGIVTTMQQ